jgi:hypothetical protein
MALENLTGPSVYISALVRTNPAIDDPISQGDDHLRGIKNVTLNTWPNITGPVTVTQSQLNSVTSKANIASPAFTGTPTAPTAAPGTNTTQLATTAFAKAAAESAGIGVNQTWQNVTGSRASGTTYTNSTGKPIQVSIRSDVDDGYCQLTVAGIVVAMSGNTLGIGNNRNFVSAIVPAGNTYAYAGSTIALWAELR